MPSPSFHRNGLLAVLAILVTGLIPSFLPTAGAQDDNVAVNVDTADIRGKGVRTGETAVPAENRWDVFKRRLSDGGIDLEFGYLGDVYTRPSGADRWSVYLHDISLTAGFDLDRLAGWPGALVSVTFLGNNGNSPSERLGDLQVISNIDAPAVWQVYELWYEQSLLQERISARAGLYDLNSEFYVAESAGLFLNSSHGIGPEISGTGLNGPSIFPLTALAVRLKADPTDKTYIQAAVIDGVPGNPDGHHGSRLHLCAREGLLLVTETGWVPGEETSGDKLALGAWHYTARFPDISRIHIEGNPIERRASRGLYVLGEKNLYREPGRPDQDLMVYGRYGLANGFVNQVDRSWSAGGVYTGLIPGRDADQLGLGIAVAANSDPYMRAQTTADTHVHKAEYAYEFTYRLQINDRFALQPNVQYVVHPGMNPDLHNTTVIGGRLEIAF